MARSPGVEVEGLKEFRSALKQLEDPRFWAKEFGAVNVQLAREVAGWAQGAASGMGGVQAHFAGQIRGVGSPASARITVASQANAAFWGAKKTTGWNAGNTTANQPAWVGASWDVGGAGGPYAINPTIAAHAEKIADEYGDRIEKFSRRAFPN